MNNENVVSLEKYAEVFIAGKKKVPDEADITQAVNTFRTMVPGVTDNEVKKAIHNLQERYYISIDTGVKIQNPETIQRWYYSSIADRGTNYWDKYRRYLESDVRMPMQVIDKLDETADDIMDSLGDPLSSQGFNKKGLVIGSVQSGKTSNYISLMNKAADSGYKAIILLTGTIEKLRQQTQSRVDEGFIGYQSNKTLNKKSGTRIGVGKYGDESVFSFTTTMKDFDIASAMELESVGVPSVFVVKKNKTILQRLENWLKVHNINRLTGKIETPLLIIDDEADNASINTSKNEDEPTIINRTIRNILNLFSKSAYVGYTATPFANIFIDPQIDEELTDDLFPRDFIYLLPQPSNYVGPSDMYDVAGKYHFMLRSIFDMEDVLPLGHEIEDRLPYLPESLEKAIMTFMLANAIRDIRGDEKKHRSMLVHLSRFIEVQNDARDKINAYVRELKLQIQNYSLAEEQSEVMQQLHSVFDEEYASDNPNESWENVKSHLHRAVMPIQVKGVNSDSAGQSLNYEEYPDGMRLIAIGGLSLARGLTLEGLMTSYFYRNTKMYDTLMQMGRWFGYRDGYADLCRLWISDESASWYAHISQATEELCLEIDRMAKQNKKPIDFGLRVRSSEDTPLIITANNKMRNTEKKKFKRSLNGQLMETPFLFSDLKKNEANNKTFINWLDEIEDYYTDLDNLSLKLPTYKNVPKHKINQLLINLTFPYLNELQGLDLIDKNGNPILDEWDVVIAGRTRDEASVPFGKHLIAPSRRNFDFFGNDEKFIRIGRTSRGLIQTAYANGGLTTEQSDAIDVEVDKQLNNKKGEKRKAPAAYMYFNTGIKRNPQLVIYPLQLVANRPSNNGDMEAIKEFAKKNDELFTGISVGIPDIDGEESITYEYVINLVKQKELLGDSEEMYSQNSYEEEGVTSDE